MKLIDGVFKYGETVVIDVDGKLLKRKVRYANGSLYIDIEGQKFFGKDISGVSTFDKSSYDQNYMKENRDRISVIAIKGTKERWKQFAHEHDMSMNAFIIDCVEKEITGE